MKTNLQLILLALAITFGFQAQAQQTDSSAKVTKNMLNLQYGLSNLTLSDEFGLSDEWALRAEFGANYVSYYGNDIVRMSISLQPRYYYNLKKRAAKNKNIANNSANFIYSKIQFYPSSKFYSRYETNLASYSQILVGYGFRRNLNKHFNYEIGAALGLAYQTRSDSPFVNYFKSGNTAYIDLGADIMLRIGYTF